SRRDAAGATALAYAVRRRTTGVLRVLLTHGADPDASDSHGTTALMAAAEIGNAAGVEVLLQNRAQKDLKDHTGRTAADLALHNRRDRSLALLRDDPTR